VRTKRIWNNIHRVRSKITHWKIQIIQARIPKSLTEQQKSAKVTSATFLLELLFWTPFLACFFFWNEWNWLCLWREHVCTDMQELQIYFCWASGRTSFICHESKNVALVTLADSFQKKKQAKNGVQNNNSQ
jgi:hypothetical protein